MIRTHFEAAYKPVKRIAESLVMSSHDFSSPFSVGSLLLNRLKIVHYLINEWFKLNAFPLLLLLLLDAAHTCNPFPDIVNASISCEVLLSGNMRCSVLCDGNYVYAPASNSYTCETNDKITSWNPLPASNEVCIRKFSSPCKETN